MKDNCQSGMTELMYQYATSGYLTLEEAKERLHADAYIRPASETLARYCCVDKNDPVALRKKVSALLTASDPSAKPGAVDRKVRMWVNEKTQFISRKSAIQLAFAMGLSVTDAEEMVQRLCGEGFHWRNPEDIVWLFALGNRMSYMDACALSVRMAPFCRLSQDAADDRDTMTENVKRQVVQLGSEKELETFLKESAPRLGELHNTAYKLFADFLNLLKAPPEEEYMLESKRMNARKMPVNEILETYLYQNLIPRGKKNKQVLKDAIQRDIQQNWPDEYVLARMTNRETDVTRKVLILLFLACDGGESDYGDFSEESEEDVFQDTYARLSSMLADCGFAPLDSRIPFDWMVLYCMVADEAFGIDENMNQFLSEVFRMPEEGQEED